MIRSLIIILILVCLGKSNIFQNLPVGEYKMEVKSTKNCNPSKDGKVQFNLYINKKENNYSEWKGNITLKVPMDDTISIEVNVAIRMANEVWRENALKYLFDKACTSIQKIVGSVDTSGLGAKLICPLPAGNYIATGFDVSNVQKFEYIPKVFAYGIYKLRVSFIDKNKERIGCILIIVELKRP